MNKTITFSDIFIHSKWRYIISFGICLLIFFLNLIIKDGWDFLTEYSNGAFIAGASMFLFGLLVLMNYFGAFELWQYVFSRKKRNSDGKKQTYGEFVEDRNVSKASSKFYFVPYLVVGVFYLIVSFVFTILI